MSGNALLNKLKERYENMTDGHPWKSKLKEVIDIIEEEENKPANDTSTNEPPPIQIDESLLKDAVRIWWDGKWFGERIPNLD